MNTTYDNNDHQQCGGGGGEETKSTNECTSCVQNIVADDIAKGINNVALLDDMSICASCGKEGNSDDMNICNKCKMVKYCNAACKKKHRSKHKKACERRVAELHDEQLFKDHPPQEECPICMQLLPFDEDQAFFESCCGKTVCIGCIYTMEMSEGGDLCAFCRTPVAKNGLIRTQKLMDKSNAEAFDMFAGYYAYGDMGLPQNYRKANELFLKAGELGCANGYCSLGNAYSKGRGTKMDMDKAKYYWELAAMGGDIMARYNLGALEGNSDNYDRAIKHWTLAARAGCKDSLDEVKQGFKSGLVTKDEFATTLRAYHERRKEMKSDSREAAAASDI